MSSLLEIRSLEKSYGSQLLFTDVSFVVPQGARIGFLGPNGSGKSTLLKIIMGLESSDEGAVSKSKGISIGYASQVPEFSSASVEEVVLNGAVDTNSLTQARILLGKAQFSDFSHDASLLSGGWKKRLDIVRSLMCAPDLLLLDEPTNHLDLEGIAWLEGFLKRERISYIVVSHDRFFLEKVATSVIELNRCYPQGVLMSEGNMSAFVEYRREFLHAQAKEAQTLSSLVRQESAWLKKTPQARTTKSRSRVQKAYELMDTYAEVKKRNVSKKVDIDFLASERETKRLLAVKNISKSFGGKELFTGVDLTLSPGVRLGVVGKNGTGKTTLLKVLAGEIVPDIGTRKCAHDLKIVYFDQHREQLALTLSLKEALSPNGDVVTYRGKEIHVNGWAQKFLFSPDKLHLPIGCLSGGERARILLAQLMLQPADVLFLDEPTNDLDIPTLEIFEDRLKEFPGAVVLISHDRWFMDTVCTEIIGLGNETKNALFSSYEQYEWAIEKVPEKVILSKERVPLIVKKNKKLSYREKKELESMEEIISQVEVEIVAVQKALESSEVTASRSLELYRELGDFQKKHEMLFERWEFLESKKIGSTSA